ncbi:MAG: hypothetical protein GTN76_11225 [Candidatus Aenigmarchaeota archaeon]|nr:hypothetical protein [Candidatus Aenigmarchaeota archaeon]NIQ18000.1 hypothetical protein [Candidatus Aenigmarchaeota archaeon]
MVTPKERDDAIFWGVIAFVVLVGAIVWLGNDAGWWTFNFPFWPIIIAWVAFAILVSAIRKIRSREAKV